MGFLKKNMLEFLLGVILILFCSIITVMWARSEKADGRLIELEKRKPLEEFQIQTLTEKIDEQTKALKESIESVKANLTTMIEKTQTEVRALNCYP